MREEIIEILCKNNETIRNSLDKNLITEGLLDSYEIVNLVMDLEEEFDIEIDPELIVPDNFKTVDDIVALIENIQ